MPEVQPPVRTGTLPLNAFLYLTRRGARVSFVRDCWKLNDGFLALLGSNAELDEDVEGPALESEKWEKADSNDGRAALLEDGSVRVDASSEDAACRRSILGISLLNFAVGVLSSRGPLHQRLAIIVETGGLD